MPAAAVIPAPIVYIKVAAVKKLVVGFRNCKDVRSVKRRVPDLCFQFSGQSLVFSLLFPLVSSFWWGLGGIEEGGQLKGFRIVYFEKIRVFKAGVT